MTTNSFVSLTTSKPENLIREFRKKVASGDFHFEELALEAFWIQYTHNILYQSYVDHLHINPNMVSRLTQIPFLPIEFFKSNQIKTGEWLPQKVFKSSGTTKTGRSEHAVDHLDFYLNHSSELFRSVYGELQNIDLIALLPSYQEQGDSSLIAMVDKLMKLSDSEQSGYYLTKPEDVGLALRKSQENGRLAIVMGVSFALLDLSEMSTIDMKGAKVIETGGMKGRRRELIRKELHNRLKLAFKADHIHSEYGMTELLSQAYSTGNGLFSENNWLKCLIRDINDPLTYVPDSSSGGINVVDLANIHSCCFIETKDIGRKPNQNSFEVLGRFDNSDIRGCNLLL